MLLFNELDIKSMFIFLYLFSIYLLLKGIDNTIYCSYGVSFDIFVVNFRGKTLNFAK